MGTLQLMKEVQVNGEIYYWSTYFGERVTSYTTNEEKAIKDFNDFKIVETSLEVIKTREL
jgi:hypothetical protein